MPSKNSKISSGPIEITYKRDVRHREDFVEVVKIIWPAGTCSVPHDHGKSYGLIRVLKGGVYQDIFRKSDLKYIGRSYHKKGDLILEKPDTVHIMGNSAKNSTSETLHCYTPALKMKTYKVKLPDKGKTISLKI